jgi:hypothetical protein
MTPWRSPEDTIRSEIDAIFAPAADALDRRRALGAAAMRGHRPCVIRLAVARRWSGEGDRWSAGASGVGVVS